MVTFIQGTCCCMKVGSCFVIWAKAVDALSGAYEEDVSTLDEVLQATQIG